MENRVKGNQKLLERILEAVEQKGKIPFSEFMEIALYHPDHGYYCRKSEIFGESGDYRTAPGIHSAFGKRIARLGIRIFRETGAPAPFVVVEFGGGTGALAEAFLREIRLRDESLFLSTDYVILERSPALQRLQEKRLGDLRERVRWAGNETEVLKPRSLSGLCIANEFFDALPFHRLRWTGAGLHEIYLKREAGEIREVESPCSDPGLESYFLRYGSRLKPGFLFEACLEARSWMRKMASSMKKGAALILDYGERAEVLHSDRYPAGTARAFFRHTVKDPDPRMAGLEDITASVNFSALQDAGLEGGFPEAHLYTQGSFLIGLGILDDFPRIEACKHVEEAFRLKELILPGGMGEAFKALLFGRYAL